MRKIHKLLLLSTTSLVAAVSAQAQDAAAPAYPQFKFNGDLRFRHEHVEKQGGAVSSYEHQRIRARVGTVVKTEDDISMEFRMATGPGRVSTNQTLGDSGSGSTQAFKNYSFLLDRANADWAIVDTFHMKVGRFANPFYQPGDSDMMWDSDLNFDGIAFRYKGKGESVRAFINTGFFWPIKDTNIPNKDVLLGAGQMGLENILSDESKWSVSVGYYGYSGINHHQGLASSTSTDGNTYDTSGSTRLYNKSFKLIDGGFDVTFPISGKAFTIFNHYVTNTKANPTPGVIAGFKWGVLKDRGDWYFNYDYRRVPENSTVGAFTDGDSFGGGTNGWSHRVSSGYQLRKNWGVAASWFYGKVNIAKGNVRQNRQLIQGDLNYRF